MHLKLLLKNIRLETGYIYENDQVTATKTELYDVLIEDGKFNEIGENIENVDAEIIDAKKQLLIPSLREMHIHIDKTYFSGEWQAPIPATDGIFSRFEEELKLLPKQLEVAEERAHQVVKHYIKNGHTHIRTHVNVDPAIDIQHIEIVKRVLKNYDDQITYEIVAFPQHGLFRNGPEFLETFEQSLQMGITHVGAVDPAIVDGNIDEVLTKTFDLAQKYDLGIDIHLHERDTLGEFEIHQMIDKIDAYEFKNNVTISHAFSLANLPPEKLDPLVQKMAERNIEITTTVAIGADPITVPVKYLYDNGVKVSFGHDSLVDHWSPFGSGDTIQKLNQFIQRFGYIDEWHIGQSLKYATGGLTPLSETGLRQWPRIGDDASALLVDAVSSAHLIARQAPISTVISKGHIIHENKFELKGEFR